jgi:ribonuclease
VAGTAGAFDASKNASCLNAGGVLCSNTSKDKVNNPAGFYQGSIGYVMLNGNIRQLATNCWSCFKDKIGVYFNSPIRIANSAFNKVAGLLGYGGSVQSVGDGGIFKNKGGLLPIRPHGYYRILFGGGITRWVIGLGGEVYYSGDHYASFSGPW